VTDIVARSLPLKLKGHKNTSVYTVLDRHFHQYIKHPIDHALWSEETSVVDSERSYSQEVCTNMMKGVQYLREHSPSHCNYIDYQEPLVSKPPT
jgi:hypothetical protein